MKTRSYPRYVKLPDNNGNFTRVAKAWKFRDSSRIYYFEPLFLLSGGVIVRKDALFEDNTVKAVERITNAIKMNISLSVNLQ